MNYPSTHTTLFWSLYDVALTLWTLYGRQNDVYNTMYYAEVSLMDGVGKEPCQYAYKISFLILQHLT